jgi:hypothetical protein
MKDTFCKRTYKCKCKAIVEDFAWESQLKETQFMCTKCGKWLGYDNLKQDKPTSIISIRTPTKNR